MNDPEGIDLLDRLDHANRQKDISDFVASVPRHHLSARDTEMLLNELQSHDSSSKASSENGDVDTAEVESKYLSRQNPEFQALTLLSREDGETVRRLMNELHQQQAENQSLVLQMNHLRLQNEALFNSDQQHRHQLENTMLTVATLEQDKMLLQAQLKEVAGFEGRQVSLSLEDLRGQLLHIANGRYEELASSFHALSQEYEEKSREYQRLIDELETENEGLSTKLDELSTEIAQRAVLYAAQERRMLDTISTRNYEVQGREKDYLELKAKFEQLEAMYEKQSKENLELTLQNRGLGTSTEDATLQIEELQEQLQTANSDLAELTARNISLETMLENLRGSDLDGVEKSLAQELERIRMANRAREESLRAQLTEARDQIATSSSVRDNLVLEIERLTKENGGYRNLLRDLEAAGMAPSSSRQVPVSPPQKDNHGTPYAMKESFLLGEDASSADQDINPDDGSIGWLTRPLAQANISSKVNQRQSESEVPYSDGHGDRVPTTHSDMDDRGIDVLNYTYLLVRNLRSIHLEDLAAAKQQIKAAILSNLPSSIANMVSEEKLTEIQEEVGHLIFAQSSVAGPKLEELTQHYESELGSMKKRYKHMKKLLETVLRRAADMGLSADGSTKTTNPVTDQNNSSVHDKARIQAQHEAIEVLTREKVHLEEHLRLCQHELRQLEELAEANKELGRHEAAHRLESQLLRQEAVVQEYKAQLQATKEELSTAGERLLVTKRELERVAKELENQQVTIKHLTIERDAFQLRSVDVEKDLEQLQQELHQVQGSYVECQQQLKESSGLVHALQEQLDAAKVAAEIKPHRDIRTAEEEDVLTALNEDDPLSTETLMQQFAIKKEDDEDIPTKALSRAARLGGRSASVELATNLATLEHLLDTSSDRLHELHDEADSAHGQVIQLQQEISLLTRENQDLRERLQWNEERAQMLVLEVEQYQLQYANERKTTVVLRMDLQQQQQQSIILRQEIDSHVKQRAQDQTTQKQLSERLTAVQQELTTALESLQQAEGIQANLSTTIKNLENDLQTARLELSAQQSLAQQLQTVVQTLSMPSPSSHSPARLVLHDVETQVVVMNTSVELQTEEGIAADRGASDQRTNSASHETQTERQLRPILSDTDGVSVLIEASRTSIEVEEAHRKVDELTQELSLLQGQLQQRQTKANLLEGELQALQTVHLALQRQMASLTSAHETESQRKDEEIARYVGKVESLLQELGQVQGEERLLMVERDRDLAEKQRWIDEKVHLLQQQALWNTEQTKQLQLIHRLENDIHGKDEILQRTESQLRVQEESVKSLTAEVDKLKKHHQVEMDAWQREMKEKTQLLARLESSQSSSAQQLRLEKDSLIADVEDELEASRLKALDLQGKLDHLADEVLSLHQAKQQAVSELTRTVKKLEKQLQARLTDATNAEMKHKATIEKLKEMHREELSRIEDALRQEIRTEMTLNMSLIEEEKLAQLQQSFDQERQEIQAIYAKELQKMSNRIETLKQCYDEQIRSSYDAIVQETTPVKTARDEHHDKDNGLKEVSVASPVATTPVTTHMSSPPATVDYTRYVLRTDYDNQAAEIILLQRQLNADEETKQEYRETIATLETERDALIHAVSNLTDNLNSLQAELITLQRKVQQEEDKAVAVASEETKRTELPESNRKPVLSLVSAAVLHIAPQEHVVFSQTTQTDLVMPSVSGEEKDSPESSGPPVPSDVPANTASTLASQTSSVSVFSIEEVQDRLSLQKQKLYAKFAAKYAKQQTVFEKEKEEILRMVRSECQDIVLETQRLLQAKRELAVQQAQVNEIIAELSQRSMFSTPLRTGSRAHGNSLGNSVNQSLNQSMMYPTSAGGNSQQDSHMNMSLSSAMNFSGLSSIPAINTVDRSSVSQTSVPNTHSHPRASSAYGTQVGRTSAEGSLFVSSDSPDQHLKPAPVASSTGLPPWTFPFPLQEANAHPLMPTVSSSTTFEQSTRNNREDVSRPQQHLRQQQPQQQQQQQQSTSVKSSLTTSQSHPHFISAPQNTTANTIAHNTSSTVGRPAPPSEHHQEGVLNNSFGTVVNSRRLQNTSSDTVENVSTKIFPEMLSPEMTKKLMQQVYDRSLTEDDPYLGLHLHSTATPAVTTNSSASVNLRRGNVSSIHLSKPFDTGLSTAAATLNASAAEGKSFLHANHNTFPHTNGHK